MLRWTNNPTRMHWLFRAVLLLALILPSTAQDFGVGPDGRPLGKLGKAVEAHFLYPAGQTYEGGYLYPLVLECQNLTRDPQYLEIDWNPQTLRMPKEYLSVLLEPGATKRLPFVLTSEVIPQVSLRINKQSVSTGCRSSSASRVTGLLSEKAEKLDYLRSLKVDKNPYYNPGNASDEEYRVPGSVSLLSADIFPVNWNCLSSLEFIVCYDLNALTLGQSQYEAMINWVRHGGQLVIVSNGLPNEYENTPLGELLPLTDQKIQTTSDRVKVVGTLVKDAKSWPEGVKDASLSYRKYDQGCVWFINTPLQGTGTLGEEQTVALWRQIFDQADPSNPYPGQFGMNLLNQVPELPRTQAGWIALFIVVYGIVVGPVNLGILRKKDKMLYSFFTVPAVAFLFAGGAYTINRVMRPANPVLREVGWLRLQQGRTSGPAQAEQVLFSPNKRLFEMSCDKNTAFVTSSYVYRSTERDTYPYWITPEDGLKRSFPMDTWDVQRFNSLSILNVPSEITVKVDEKARTVTIDSPLESEGQSAALKLDANRMSALFTLKKGETVVSFDDLSGTNYPQTDLGAFPEEQYPGRSELINNVWKALDEVQVQTQAKVEKGRLLFWTQGVSTPIEVDGNAIHKHDYLVTVEFDV